MNLTITHNGFHGWNTVVVRVDPATAWDGEIEVSAGVARRINQIVCGLTDCRCGEHIAHEIAPDRYAILVGDDWDEGTAEIDMRGNYPQF